MRMSNKDRRDESKGMLTNQEELGHDYDDEDDEDDE